RPPTVAPFPYTTLFRSTLGLRFLQLAQRVFALGIERLSLLLDGAALDVGALLANFDGYRLRCRTTLARIDRQLADRATLERHLTDRKSTRLNSSHVKIS